MKNIISQVHLSEVAGLLQDTGIILELYWNYTGIILELYWNYTGIILELYWNYTGKHRFFQTHTGNVLEFQFLLFPIDIKSSAM